MPPLHSPNDRLERLYAARQVLATLVTEDTCFLPFFLRLEEEVRRAQSVEAALERARQLAA
jgi:hypothetical protein